ncbi:hypothetical protein AWC38_SpisGene17908 [Stylophora pistillata]|uniref:Uncharacterized protein n=1 Tax=Stylophora pistillata TaxID=50429 RepID=A0A2B4RH87_STYPI|nr:hypothetical protein AWC38_SpisGene17908 [Stylophora pistillata]
MCRRSGDVLADSQRQRENREEDVEDDLVKDLDLSSKDPETDEEVTISQRRTGEELSSEDLPKTEED